MRSGTDLWLLRGVYQLAACEHCEAEARRRVNDLLPAFEGWVPPTPWRSSDAEPPEGTFEHSTKSPGTPGLLMQCSEGPSVVGVNVHALRFLVEQRADDEGRGGGENSRGVMALEGMRKFDLGGLEVSYSPEDHTGVGFADLSIIGNDGKFKR